VLECVSYGGWLAQDKTSVAPRQAGGAQAHSFSVAYLPTYLPQVQGQGAGG
jgi:hypothetical protein